MLQAGKSNSVTFKVNVMGTSSDPKVRLVLGTNPELMFPATKDVTTEDSWNADVNLPDDVSGEFQLRVEVLLNDRLFTPLSKLVEVQSSNESAPSDAQSIPSPTVPEPEVIDVTEDDGTGIGVDVTGTSTVSGDISPNLERIGKPVKRILPPTIAVSEQPPKPKQTSGLSLLQTLATTPAKKVYNRVKTPLPKPGSKPTRSTKISLADVNSIAKSDKKIPESKIIPQPKTKTSTVKLVREELFYE